MKILFVCLGNICRSPALEEIARVKMSEAALTDVTLDSAGTGNWHTGDAPDERSVAACLAAGYDIRLHRARQVTLSDFYEFDLILAADQQNYNDLNRLAPPNATAKIDFAMRYAKNGTTLAIPDPYYGGKDGFKNMVTMCENVAAGLVEELRGKS